MRFGSAGLVDFGGGIPRSVESHCGTGDQASTARRDRLPIGPQVANLPHMSFITFGGPQAHGTPLRSRLGLGPQNTRGLLLVLVQRVFDAAVGNQPQ